MRYTKYYLPAIFWACVIFAVSHLPSYDIPSMVAAIDDVILHFLEYSVFGFLLAHAFVGPKNKLPWKRIIIAVVAGMIYAATDEFHQSFVPGRTPEISDFLADTIGIISASILYYYVRLYLLKRKATVG